MMKMNQANHVMRKQLYCCAKSSEWVYTGGGNKVVYLLSYLPLVLTNRPVSGRLCPFRIVAKSVICLFLITPFNHILLRGFHYCLRRRCRQAYRRWCVLGGR
ncbi:hypothetical protein F4820DRAFT_406101 [Hypoxylon rubiginosum]|uniref:Uncharacterized protein n=1 Tax=Hypoxylon rubiginosum TaxID=110542 RepID=A0ACB9ZDE6_9PEZI|nr:hypothetical protein F4820DRAFT_406101 [Hypoxylon rubiginosum]